MRNRSNAQYSNARVPAPNIQRSTFYRPFSRKMTLNEADLVPFLVDEILPGDTYNLHCQVVARVLSLQVPVMDNMYADLFFFFVPWRLLWDNWEPFISGYSGRGEDTDYEIPQLQGADPGSVQFNSLSLGDFFGLPVGQIINTDDAMYGVSAGPFRAYYMIYNEWFRDENLQDELDFPTDDGPDLADGYVLQKRNKRPDYFSTCLPWPQKGTAVELPLGTAAPVIGNGMALGLVDTSSNYGLATVSGGAGHTNMEAFGGLYGQPVGTVAGSAVTASGKAAGVTDDPTKSGLYADLNGASAATINTLRLAVTAQQMLEADARGGTRYTEHLQSHWSVAPEDYRLQRPEYLGGSSNRWMIQQVPQTAASTADSKQANLAAYGQIATSCSFSKSFVEHGWLIGLVNIRADVTYQEGLRRMWTRKVRFDHYFPILAHLGEQPVYVGELCYNENNPSYQQIFGYQERWAEYRYGFSDYAGAFRSVYTGGSLDFWHLGLDFIGESGTGLPTLNSTFITDAPPIDRIVAVTDEPHFQADILTQIKAARPMPVFSIPGLTRF